jgi:hypothetical protein
MLKSWLPFFSGPEDAGSGGGTTDNVAGSVTSGTEPQSSGNVTSGTASDAMIKAAMAASSAEGSAAGAQADGTAALTNGIVGDTSKVVPPGEGDANKPTTTGQPETGAAATGGKEAPEPRIVAAVKNARADERAIIDKEIGWARGLSKDNVSVALDITSEIAANPQEFATRLAGELGMKLVPANQPAAAEGGAADFKLPAPRLRAEDGTAAYSADQMPEIVKGIVAHVTSTLNSRLQPIETERQQTAAQAKETAALNQRVRIVTGALNKARELPHFKENEPAILQVLKDMPAEDRRALGPIAAMHQAYNTFLATKIFPSIETAAEERVKKSWGKKAATSTGSGHPSNNGGTGTKERIRDGDVGGLAARMAAMAEAQQ